MADKITAAMQQVIKDNLPAQVGETLQERLAAVDEMEKELTKARKEVKAYQESNNEFYERNKKLEAAAIEVEKREVGVAQREQAVLEKENKEEVLEAQAKQAVAEGKYEAARELTSLVFKNSVVRRSIHQSDNMGSDYTPSGHSKHYKTGHNTTEEVVQE